MVELSEIMTDEFIDELVENVYTQVLEGIAEKNAAAEARAREKAICCYAAKIAYTIDDKHPDWEYSEMNADKVYEYEDEYRFYPGGIYSDTEERRTAYIKNDLSLIAGGGYNTRHIHNVKFDIRRI